MATVTVRASTSAASGAAAATTLALILPTCSSGDLLYLFVGNNTGTTAPLTTPTGWTLLDSNNARVDNYGWLLTKTATSGDSGATLTLTFGAGCHSAATAVALLATHDAEISTTKGTDATTLTIPAITPVAADCLELGFVSSCTRAGTDAPGLTAPAGWTELTDAVSTGSSGNNIEVGIYTHQLAGQAGTAQATADVGVAGNAHSGLMYATTAAPTSAPPTPHTVFRLDASGTLTPIDITPLT